jgi:hypothetical protein
MQIGSSSTSSQAIECTESESQSCTISSVSETQCPIDGMTASREIGLQRELLVDHIPIIKPMISCIATQNESMLFEFHTPAFATVGGNDIAQSDQEVIYIDAPSLKESTSLPECHSPRTFAETTVLLEKVSPQKSICSEYTCTLTDIDHDELYMPSAESQTETENENVEIEKSPVEQKQIVVFEKNLDELFVTCSTCAKPIAEQSKKCIGSMVVVQAVCVDVHQNK